MNKWEHLLVNEDTTLRDALGVIDHAQVQGVLVVDSARKLLGILVDGDVRRALLKGFDLSTTCAEVMNPNPVSVSVEMSREVMLTTMRKHSVHLMPVLNRSRVVVGVFTSNELLSNSLKLNKVVLMAGGRGERLRPLTDANPKPMLNLGGAPILESIIKEFVYQGFNNFAISVNYLGNIIKDYFGDGSQFGISISYIHEDEPLGTAGSLGHLKENSPLPVIVMNADTLTTLRFTELLTFHDLQGASATMALRSWGTQIPYGVVSMDGESITEIREKPIENHLVNAGIYVLSPESLAMIAPNQYLDMTDLFIKLIADGHKVCGYEARGQLLDIGRLEDYEKAERELGLFRKS